MAKTHFKNISKRTFAQLFIHRCPRHAAANDRISRKSNTNATQWTTWCHTVGHIKFIMWDRLTTRSPHKPAFIAVPDLVRMQPSPLGIGKTDEQEFRIKALTIQLPGYLIRATLNSHLYKTLYGNSIIHICSLCFVKQQTLSLRQQSNRSTAASKFSLKDQLA